MNFDPFVTGTAQHCVALLMLAGGLHKGIYHGRFSEAIARYRVVPEKCVRTLAVLLAGIEVAIGMASMVPRSTEVAAVAAAGLLSLYLAVMATSLLRGDRLDCGCSFGSKRAFISGAHLLRNGVLVILALMASMPHSGRVLGVLDALQIAAAVVSLALIYVSSEILLAHGGNIRGREA